jgi:Na+-transporting methylmalonyl-CoA/oxaloacetate decarboxylase gamma subunit
VNGPWPYGDPRDVVHRVLTDARFQRAAQRPGEKSWFDYVTDFLRDLWHRLTAPLETLTGNTTLTTIVGIGVLIAVLVLFAIVVVRFARRTAWRRPVREHAAPAALGEDADARTLLARALAAAAAGRHHDAAALLWASALRALDERGRVKYDPARTPGEWRRAVRDPYFDSLARDAVVALFGDRGADAALVVRMQAAYDRVVAP